MNIRDIAKKTKVSIATVSRYLDPDKRSLVNVETQKILERVIRQSNYIPNQAARMLSGKKCETIGLLTPFSSDVVRSPYFQEIIGGILEGVRPLHHDLKWIMLRNEEISTCNFKAILRKHWIDGLIVTSWQLFSGLIKEIESLPDIPAVLINCFSPAVRCSIHYVDNRFGVEQALDYLLSKKYRTIGMMRGPEYSSWDAMERYKAFKAFFKKKNIKVKPEYVRECPRFEKESASQVMDKWIREGKLPRAILAANDDMAYGIIHALEAHGIKVPQEVAVCGFDGIQAPMSEKSVLTSVRQPLEAMGRASAETLVRLLEKKAIPPIQSKFNTELIRGDTA